MNESKTRVLTGVKPTGNPHIGNYLGAIRPALELAAQDNIDSFLFIADYHALNGGFKPQEIYNNTLNVAATWLALGLNPEVTTFYRQSDIPEVLELNAILMNYTPKGLMNRAHAYKAAVQQAEDDGKKDPDALVNMGLYTYPILMAADILTFDGQKVPVGEDQLQHLEIARDIAGKLNHALKKKVLLEPEPIIQKVGTIVGIDGRKMSKSYNNTVELFTTEKKLRKTIMKIKTDSSPPEAPKNPDDSLIFDFYKLFATPEKVEAFAEAYKQGLSWGDAKQTLFEEINTVLAPARERYFDYVENPKKMDDILQDGAERARTVAKDVLERVREGLGLRRNLTEPLKI